jgi:hypothetical protein
MAQDQTSVYVDRDQANHKENTVKIKGCWIQTSLDLDWVTDVFKHNKLTAL